VKDLFARCAAIGSASQQPTTTSTPLTTTSKRDPPSTTTNDTNPSYPSTSRHRKRPRTTASSASPRTSTHDRESVCSRDVSTASMFTDVTPSAPRGAKQQTGDGQQTLLNPAEIATVAEDSRDGRANTTWQSDKRLKTSASDNTNPIAESTTERISQSPVKHAEERALNRDVSDSSSSLLDCKCGSQDCFKHIVLITEYPAQSKKTAVCQQLMYGGEKNVVPLGYMSIQLRSQHEISTHMAAKQRNHPLPPTATSHTATSLPPTHLLASSLSATILSAASLSPADISCHPLLRALQRQGFDPTQCILMSASPALSHTHVRRFADFSMTSCPLTGQSSSFPLTGPGQSPLTGHPSSSSLAGPSSHLASTDLVSSSSVVSPSLAVLEHGSVVLADMGMAIAAKHGVVEPLKQREGDIMTLWYVLPYFTPKTSFCESAEILVSLSRLLSHYRYRAPELILGSPSYTNKIDIWGTGCIFLECLLLSCPFQGKEVKQEYQKSQFQAICNLLGNPEFSKPGILRQSRWYVTALQELKLSTTCAALDDVVCGIISGPEQATCLDLLLKLLTFNPEKRISALEALQHPFFDSCRSFYVSPNASAPHVKARTKDRGTHETISLSLPDPNNLFCLGASLAKGNDSSTETLGSRAPGSEQDKSAVAGEHEVWVHVPIKYRRRRHREKKVVSSSNK